MYLRLLQSIMGTISASIAISMIMLLSGLFCRSGQAEELAEVQQHRIKTMNLIFYVSFFYKCHSYLTI